MSLKVSTVIKVLVSLDIVVVSVNDLDDTKEIQGLRCHLRLSCENKIKSQTKSLNGSEVFQNRCQKTQHV